MRDQSLFLSKAWQEFEQSLAFIPDVLLVTSLEGRIEQCSPSANLLFKMTERDLLDRSLLDFIATEDQSQVEAKIATLDRLHGVGRLDARIVPREGPMLTAEFRMSTRRESNGNGDAMVFWIIRDISQRKFIEDRLRLTERLATLGTFASNMAHELNNPLASLLLTARHAQRSLSRPEVINTCLQDIISDSERCAEIIKKLRTFAKKQYSKKIVVSLNSLLSHIESVLHNVAAESGVSLSVGLSSDELPVCCNPIGLEQAIMALIASALHNGTRNSKFSVRTESRKEKSRIVIESQSADHSSIQSDRDFASHIPVNPADITSSGMGLITAYGIIHEHHGELLSEPRSYGQFVTCIQFPMAEMPDPEPAAKITKS